MGGSAARPAVPYGRTDIKYGITNGTESNETLVNGKPLGKSEEAKVEPASSDFYRNAGALAGGFEAGIGGAIIGGMLGSILDD